MATNEELCLGIDLGTTSIKLSLVSTTTKSLVFTTYQETNANVSSSAGSVGAEQDVGLILSALIVCLNRITDTNRACIKCICVSGQMHGILMWNSDLPFPIVDTKQLSLFTSNLYTWEDKRATAQLLSTLPDPDSHQLLASGFGNVTVFWLVHNEPQTFVKYDTMGGIMDFLTCLLCGLDKPVVSHQIAASWGYFNSTTNTWNVDM